VGAESRTHAITTTIVAAAIANEIAITDPRNTAMQCNSDTTAAI